MQDMAPAGYRTLKRDIVVRALALHGVEAEVSQAVEVPQGTRRRCVFKIVKRGGEVAIGFHARASHDIVDMRECRVLTPALVALVPRLRAIMTEVLRDGDGAEARITQTDAGFDLLLRWKKPAAPGLVAQLAAWAERSGVARIASNNDILVELAAPTLRIGAVQVRLPPGAFLQPTREGEIFLQDQAAEALSKAKSAVDLFAGCGTFSLALARRMKVHAVELDAAQLAALALAARTATGLKPVTTEKRDLFKRPLSARELASFDAAILDPPRAGAAAQVAELAKSGLRRIVYVSCNADSFARDARALMGAGYKIGNVTPVDQFLWSEHIELVACFTRD
jgi:23S rRNA (uracil1939-C5)-methyltransferase